MNKLTYSQQINRLECDLSVFKGYTHLGPQHELAFAAGHIQGIQQSAEIAAKADDTIAALVKALREATEKFRSYERAHLTKFTFEGNAKARANALMAEYLEAVLERAGLASLPAADLVP